MSRVIYKTGDATQPDLRQGSANYLIHVCNDQGGWGAGFTGALSKRYTQPERAYREWYRRIGLYGSLSFELSGIQLVSVGQHLTVVNMLAQRGYRTQDNLKPFSPVDFTICCIKLYNHIDPSHKLCPPVCIHLPRVGCGLGGGTWEEVEVILHKYFVAEGIKVIVYDQP